MGPGKIWGMNVSFIDLLSIATATLVPSSGKLEEHKYSVRTVGFGER